MTNSAVPLIWNPTAGSGRTRRHRRGLDRTAARLGVVLDWQATQAPCHATELARRAAELGAPMVLAFGGDGTYNEVACGLVGSRTALGLLPGGTTSVLRFEFGLPRSPDRALEAILAGEDRPVRVGRTDAGHVFLLMVSAGPDSLVLDRLPTSLKRRGGKTAIAAQAALEFTRARLPTVRATVGGQTFEGGWAIIGNSRYYAGPFEATPGANPCSPDLELVLQTRVGRGAAVGFIVNLALGRHIRRRDIVRATGTEVRLEPADERPVSYQIDGDAVGVLPITVGIGPEPLLMRIPCPETVGA